MILNANILFEMNLKEFPTYFGVFSGYIGVFSGMFIGGFPSPSQKQLIDEDILRYQYLPLFASGAHLTRSLGLIIAPILVQIGLISNL